MSESCQLDDITLLQNILRSKKSRTNHLKFDPNESTSTENAFEIRHPAMKASPKFGFKTPAFVSRKCIQ